MPRYPRTRAFDLVVLLPLVCTGAAGCSSNGGSNGSSGSGSGSTSGSTSGASAGTSGATSGAASGGSGSSSGSLVDGGETALPDGSEAATNEGGDEATSEASADAEGVTLTVLNYQSWCSVSINGGAASTSTSVLATLPSGSTASIVVQPASSMFVIGPDPWFGVIGDDGGGAPGLDSDAGTVETSTATVVVVPNANTATGSACVSVCCGDAPSGTGCPTTNPCL
jgi:hypothetical protein